MFNRIVNILMALFVVVVLAAALLHGCQRQQLKAELEGFPRISKQEEKHINKVLAKKGCGDCALTPRWYGWQCVDKDGQVFRVYAW